MSDMKEEIESQYSVNTLKETTPLSKTGPFVYENPAGPDEINDNNLNDGQPTTDNAEHY